MTTPPTRAIESRVPGMYHRRLWLICGVMAGVILLLGAQLGRLSVVEGAQWRERALRSLRRSTLLSTYRGRILDRRGRVLALDQPGYALAVQFDVITGRWEHLRARRQAVEEIGRATWRTLTPEQRVAETESRVPAWHARTRRLWDEICRRGVIDAEELNRRLDEIRGMVQSRAAAVYVEQRARELERRGLDDEESAEEGFRFRFGGIREEHDAHVVLPSLRDDVAFGFRTLAQELPDMFEVRDARRREYPWHQVEVPLSRASLPLPLRDDRTPLVQVVGAADHLLGSMRTVHAADVDRRPFRVNGVIDHGGYLPVDDTVGARGLERTFEDHLRGARGEIRRRLDTGVAERRPAVPGRDLELTIDIAVQARIEALLSPTFGLAMVQEFHEHPVLPVGWPLNAAAVVVEVQTGEVLALASMPTQAMGTAMDPLRRQMDAPWVNRAAEGFYPPGSIIKPIVLCAAVAEGVYRIGEEITCTGHYFPNVQHRFRCWVYREQYQFQTHEAISAAEALGRSCNMFFYTLGDRMGLGPLTDRCRAFGLGAVLDTGLRDEGRGEGSGLLLSEERIAALDSRERRAAGISMAIGQGSAITWTPLQAANAYATIARRGVVRDATLLADDPRPPRPARPDVEIDDATLATVLEGLHLSVAETWGTGHAIRLADGTKDPIFNADRVTVWGKTGTAQAPSLRTKDTNEDGRIDSKDEEGFVGADHAWFVGLVGPGDTAAPMFAIAVIVEHGGSGGRVAGPIANQIIHALQDEGYLPGALIAAAGRPVGESR